MIPFLLQWMIEPAGAGYFLARGRFRQDIIVLSAMRMLCRIQIGQRIGLSAGVGMQTKQAHR